MNKQTKLILSILGIAALLIPAVLLVIQTSKKTEVPAPLGGNRNIDQTIIKKTIDEFEQQQQRRNPVRQLPSPSSIPESTESAQQPSPPASAQPIPGSEGIPGL